MTTINIRQLRVSAHARYERWERITESIKSLNGIGEIALIVKSHDKGREEETYHIVTTTGMVFVVVPTLNLLVTAYAGTVKKVFGLYQSAGYTRIPDDLYQTIRFTEKYYSYLYEM